MSLHKDMYCVTHSVVFKGPPGAGKAEGSGDDVSLFLSSFSGLNQLSQGLLDGGTRWFSLMLL